ncbi:MAG: hypothetical protein HKN21_10175 [Candidatus Eisenbacteria bacterium]|uniref:Uncharacterized protein n=1 Tax=Eiseniibacteriota bacterium TaxID=2212470 RepID=A0A7Y2H2K5_UNCEI|nr:hypothetical protein [Candidatus Eisenbacteria bacterium]
MTRQFRFALAFVLVGMLVSAPAMATIPDPAFSNAPGFMTVTPDGSFGYTVNVANSGGPLSGSFVQIVVSGPADGLVCWCTGQTHPVIDELTNASGDATFFVAGGGCITATGLGATVAEVFADGILLGQIEINSPDVVDAAGFVNTDPGYTGDPTCNVGLSDAVFHTAPISLGQSEPCSNFTDPFNDAVSLSDAVIVTPYIVNGTSCN